MAVERIESADKDSRIAELEVEINELTQQIRELETDLKKSKSKEVKGLVKTGFFVTLPSATVIALTSSLVNAANYWAAPEEATGLTRYIGDYVRLVGERQK